MYPSTPDVQPAFRVSRRKSSEGILATIPSLPPQTRNRMHVSEALEGRRTIRGFKPSPVPDEKIREIFEAAQLAPSNCNTQPWNVVVISGTARDKLEKALLEEILSGKKPSPAFPPGDVDLTGVYRERQHECARRYYGTMGIGRDDRDARNELMMRNWQFFGAPHVAFICMPVSMGPVNAIDVGIYLQTLMLLMVEHGLGSCPQGALAFFPDPVREIADIPDETGIICGLSFGYVDEDAVINTARMSRAAIDDCVTFVS